MYEFIRSKPTKENQLVSSTYDNILKYEFSRNVNKHITTGVYITFNDDYR